MSIEQPNFSRFIRADFPKYLGNRVNAYFNIHHILPDVYHLYFKKSTQLLEDTSEDPA
jgi:hypothetical protein